MLLLARAQSLSQTTFFTKSELTEAKRPRVRRTQALEALLRGILKGVMEATELEGGPSA